MTASSTRKDKIKISPKPSDGQEAHFRPIVDFCLANGCRFNGTNEKIPFRTDRGGVSRCIMVGPVTMQDVLDVFELPDTFKVVWDRSPYIEDPDYLVLFFLSSEEEDARQKAKGEAILARARARMEARRKAHAEAAARGGE